MIDAGMLRLQEQGRMELSQIAGLTACYLPELYEAETYVCRRILSMADGEYPEPGRIDDLVAEIENRQGIDYAPEQRSAIRAAASRQLLIVTGGPGTGKTTVMSGILRLFDALRLKTQLAAPFRGDGPRGLDHPPASGGAVRRGDGPHGLFPRRGRAACLRRDDRG